MATVNILNVMPWRGKGGTERAFLTTCQMLKNQGMFVVGMVDSGFPLISDLENTKTKIEKGPFDSKRRNWKHAFKRKITELIGKYNIDLIILHTHEHRFAISEIKNLATPVMIFYHMPLPSVSSRTLRKFVGTCEHYVVLNRVDKNRLASIGVKNVTVLGNALFHEPKKLRGHSGAMGILGTIDPWKGHDIVIETMARLQLAGQNVPPLLVGGKGGKDYVNFLKKMATQYGLGSRIKYLGYVKKIEPFFKKIDFLLVPSRIEAFGLVAIESMSYGRPVIASRTPGPLEFIKNRKNGLLFKIDSSLELSRCIKNIQKNRGLYKKLSVKAFRDSFTYTQKSVGPKLKKIIWSLVKKNI